MLKWITGVIVSILDLSRSAVWL